MGLLEPWLKADRLAAIDLRMLKSIGVDTLLIDMDNTLVPWHTFDMDEPTAEWLSNAKELGFKICILSNNKRWRIEKISGMLGVKGVWGAMKPLLRGYRKALKAVRSDSRTAAFIGDQVFTDMAGANILGIKTILVNPLSHREYKWTRFMRRIERLVTGRSIKRGAEEHGR